MKIIETCYIFTKKSKLKIFELLKDIQSFPSPPSSMLLKLEKDMTGSADQEWASKIGTKTK